ncbi:MAG: hypothetical protein Kapaf2KO_18050 [Candidatus Kapaibacteriales bacterium]
MTKLQEILNLGKGRFILALFVLFYSPALVFSKNDIYLKSFAGLGSIGEEQNILSPAADYGFESSRYGFGIELGYKHYFNNIFLAPSIGYGLYQVEATGLESFPIFDEEPIDKEITYTTRFREQNFNISLLGGYRFDEIDLELSTGIRYTSPFISETESFYTTDGTFLIDGQVSRTLDFGQGRLASYLSIPFEISWDLFADSSKLRLSPLLGFVYSPFINYSFYDGIENIGNTNPISTAFFYASVNLSYRFGESNKEIIDQKKEPVSPAPPFQLEYIIEPKLNGRLFNLVNAESKETGQFLFADNLTISITHNITPDQTRDIKQADIKTLYSSTYNCVPAIEDPVESNNQLILNFENPCGFSFKNVTDRFLEVNLNKYQNQDENHIVTVYYSDIFEGVDTKALNYIIVGKDDLEDLEKYLSSVRIIYLPSTAYHIIEKINVFDRIPDIVYIDNIPEYRYLNNELTKTLKNQELIIYFTK